jgi:hypothetical protein
VPTPLSVRALVAYGAATSLVPIWNFPITAERQAALRAMIEGRATAA